MRAHTVAFCARMHNAVLVKLNADGFAIEPLEARAKPLVRLLRRAAAYYCPGHCDASALSKHCSAEGVCLLTRQGAQLVQTSGGSTLSYETTKLARQCCFTKRCGLLGCRFICRRASTRIDVTVLCNTYTSRSPPSPPPRRPRRRKVHSCC